MKFKSKIEKQSLFFILRQNLDIYLTTIHENQSDRSDSYSIRSLPIVSTIPRAVIESGYSAEIQKINEQ
jgi:hypothetical protein